MFVILLLVGVVLVLGSVFVIRVLAGVHPFVVVFGAGVVLVGQSYSSDSGAGGASGMCAGGVRAVLVVLAGRSYSLVVAHVVVCVLAAFVLCWQCWQVGCTRWQWLMWWRVLAGWSYSSAMAMVLVCVLAAFTLCWWCWRVGCTCWRWHMWWRVCWQHSCCAGGSVILVGGGGGAGVCAGGVCADAGGVGVGLDTHIS